MRLYTVHLKDTAPADGGSPPAFELVKDGFCWAAFFLPLLWAVWRGQWTGLLLYLICILATSTLTVMAAPGEAVEIALGLGLAVLVGFSANDWRRWRLQRQGYRNVGAVAAADADEAALRVLEVLDARGNDRKSGNLALNEQAVAAGGPWDAATRPAAEGRP
ncbi:DUF2628 domain-containing protein [Marinibaculum pumilum]|uniref:DUF2628 domain-containing protein n=1 Tax=Marinibaculum pumilum TaxID=1766165 RepID=A0ABV7L6G7_9PROT